MAHWVLVAKPPAVGPRYCEFTDGRLEIVRQGTERGVVLRTLEERFLRAPATEPATVSVHIPRPVVLLRLAVAEHFGC